MLSNEDAYMQDRGDEVIVVIWYFISLLAGKCFKGDGYIAPESC
jgi:hypothetical protein